MKYLVFINSTESKLSLMNYGSSSKEVCNTVDATASLAKKDKKGYCNPARKIVDDESILPKSVDDIPHLPVFLSEEEAIAFEAHCAAIDLSIADNLYTKIEIEQPIINVLNGYKKTLAVYQCNHCQRLNRSVKDAQLHCLIHTDIMPFTCTKCSYATSHKCKLPCY